METFEIGLSQVAVPAEARDLCSLSRIDYEDAFLVETSAAQGRTATEWVKAILEDARAAG